MPRKHSTAAKKARKQQAETGEKYTSALRAQKVGPVRFRAFSAEGAGWAPIIERAEQKLDQVRPGLHRWCWSEKFGELVPNLHLSLTALVDLPRQVRRVLWEAEREAAVTCQTCPSPGRKRVVYTWDSYYGWVMPWVKTCCDACYHVPEHLGHDRPYLDLVRMYEEPAPKAGSR